MLNELPKFASIRRVAALRIKHVNVFHVGEGAELIPHLKKYSPIVVDGQYVSLWKPEPGGYYVVLDTGEETYVSGDEFEKSYRRMWGLYARYARGTYNMPLLSARERQLAELLTDTVMTNKEIAVVMGLKSAESLHGVIHRLFEKLGLRGAGRNGGRVKLKAMEEKWRT